MHRRYTDEERDELERLAEDIMATDPDETGDAVLVYVGQDVGHMDLLSELGLK